MKAHLTMPVRILTLAAVVLSLLAVTPPTAAYADIIYTPRNSHGEYNGNGVKVYLSRACHNGSSTSNPCFNNIGCSGHMGENTWSEKLTSATLYEPDGSSGLVNRQYTVRIGTGKLQNNISNSNSWGSDVHLPVHSNASGTGSCGTSNSTDGTWGLYVSTSGSQMADAFVRYLGSGSPGPNDKIVKRTNLGELNDTNMPAGYLEAAFHTNRRGMEWLEDYEYYDWRIGYAVDKCAGYPRHGRGDTSSALCPWL